VAEDIAGVVRRFNEEVIGQGKIDLIDELLAPDFVEHQEFPGLEPNREGVKKFFAMWRQAFPDARTSIDLLVVQGDLAAVYATWEGTHQGEFLGVPGTGRQFAVPNADFIRFRDGIAVEHWGVFDSGVMVQQLAIVPSMAAVGA
jgi:steroid delta-isomerase-like uncharacterized protein